MLDRKRANKRAIIGEKHNVAARREEAEFRAYVKVERINTCWHEAGHLAAFTRCGVVAEARIMDDPVTPYDPVDDPAGTCGSLNPWGNHILKQRSTEDRHFVALAGHAIDVARGIIAWGQDDLREVGSPHDLREAWFHNLDDDEIRAWDAIEAIAVRFKTDKVLHKLVVRYARRTRQDRPYQQFRRATR